MRFKDLIWKALFLGKMYMQIDITFLPRSKKCKLINISYPQLCAFLFIITRTNINLKLHHKWQCTKWPIRTTANIIKTICCFHERKDIEVDVHILGVILNACCSYFHRTSYALNVIFRCTSLSFALITETYIQIYVFRSI